MVIFTASDFVARIVAIMYRRYKIRLTAVVHLACCLWLKVLIRHFGNENETGTEYGVASACGIVWGDARSLKKHGGGKRKHQNIGYCFDYQDDLTGTGEGRKANWAVGFLSNIWQGRLLCRWHNKTNITNFTLKRFRKIRCQDSSNPLCLNLLCRLLHINRNKRLTKSLWCPFNFLFL